MDDNEFQENLQEQLNSRFLWTIASLLDAGFLILWLTVQWLVSRAQFLFPLSGLDEWVFLVFQLLFGVSTLSPIAMFIYKDLRIMATRTRKAIELEELKLNRVRNADK